ncbi:MAG: hypothetical protein IJE22_02190 [Oscillibacter sp.]|nr:hypothetical protein [Oscillibacter sp.]
MKKQEKLDVIKQAIHEPAICRCFFTYEPGHRYYYPNAVNDKFILGQEEDDFILDGYCIRKISQLKKVAIKDDKCNEINRIFGITDGIGMPDVDISSWQTVFESLMRLDAYVEIEDAVNEQFAIGVIEKVFRDKLHFKPFDADGIWDEAGLEIRYSQITSVKWGTRYADYWKRFLENTGYASGK